MNSFQKAINWYFSKYALPYWCILLLDCLFLFLSGVFVYYLYHRGFQTLVDFRYLSHTLLVVVIISALFYKFFHTYDSIVRYSSFVDLLRIAYANGMAFIVVVVLYKALPHLDGFAYFPPRMLLASMVIATASSWAVRVLAKLLYEADNGDDRGIRVLIYGALSGGVGLAKNIRSQKPRRFDLRGFISHDTSLKHSLLMGQKVFVLEDDLAAIIDNEHIEAILVSPFRADDFRNDQDFQNMLINKGVKIYMTQMAKEWSGKDDDFTGMQLHEVEVEDLLPRDKIEVDMVAIGRLLQDRRILITGAAGSIGSEMVRQVAKYKPSEMVLIDQAETPMHDIQVMMASDYPNVRVQTIVTSICKQDRMEEIFASFRPEYVFHAAAYKHVPMMEFNPKEAVQNNIYGTRVIADLAVKYGTKKFVMISTDKAVNPTNVMGCSKRICEIYCQSLNGHQQTTQFVTTRFGNVLGSNGSVIPLFRQQIKDGGPVTVTHMDIIRYFMLIPEACQLVLEAGTMGKGGEIFVFDMGKPVKIIDLVRRMIKLSGAKHVRIEVTGLREGEKLYEEVLSDKEQTIPTIHPKIMVAKVREYDYDEILRLEQELYDLSFTGDDMAVVKKMKEIVPEFKSKNSRYEVLD